MPINRLRLRRHTLFCLRYLVVVALGLIPLTGTVLAGQVELAWDGVQGASGYRVYHGTSSGTYAANLDAGNSTTATVAELADGARYYFAVQAYNATASSSLSNEVSKVVSPTAPELVASFTANGSNASSLNVSQGQIVNLLDTSTGTVESRNWALGDGTSATSSTVVKAYSNPGTMTVRLSVAGAGKTSTASKIMNVVSTPPVATNSANSTDGAPPDSTSGLMAAYGFDEISGNQTLDASGKGNHGTLANAARSTQAKFGRSLSFNGANSLITVKDSDSLDLANAMTLAAWVFPTNATAKWETLILKKTSSGQVYSLYPNSGAGTPNSALRIGDTETELYAGSRLPRDIWTHLATTYDGSRQRLYVNGVQVGSRSQAGSLQASTGPLEIGGNTVFAEEYFQGLIDEVRVYNRALSQTEIQAIANEPVAPPISVCATPCTLWTDATTPVDSTTGGSLAVELGVKIRSDVDGVVTGVRFYKDKANTGTHVGRLWTDAGELLAEATFATETASGWQQVNFGSPVAVQANAVFVATYHSMAGHFSYTEGYFDSAYSKGPLHVLSSQEGGGNGVYLFGSGGTFPTKTYRSANFWVDAVFKTP